MLHDHRATAQDGVHHIQGSQTFALAMSDEPDQQERRCPRQHEQHQQKRAEPRIIAEAIAARAIASVLHRCPIAVSMWWPAPTVTAIRSASGVWPRRATKIAGSVPPWNSGPGLAAFTKSMRPSSTICR